MDSRYRITETSGIITPALLVFYETLQENIDKMLRIARDTTRLRPHCKTHKMREVIRLQLESGITKHKAATFAEAEMLVSAGVRDVVLAYNLVGPNIGRAVKFVSAFPEVRFAVTADHPRPVADLGAAMAAAACSIDVLLDLDTGQQRTGIAIGPEAEELYQSLATTPGVRPGGLHVYDGQNHQSDALERRGAVRAVWNDVARFRESLEQKGWPVPRIVAGGTGSFPMFAEIDDPVLEFSPGTCAFHDTGYGAMFPDLDFVPAALVLTRVISRPADDRVTLDLGYKAIASDRPVEQRLVFPELPDARTVLQNEEHLVVTTSRADEFQPGDALLAIPGHVCPTSALHKQAIVVRGGRVIDRWDVAARDRRLTI